MQALQNENFAKVVYTDGSTPQTSTIFSETSPPTVDDPTLKENSNNIYINPSGQAYIWNGTAYVTYSPTQTTEWYLGGTAIDAQANKNSFVWRSKGVGVGTSLTAANSNQFQAALYAGHDDFGVNKQQFLFRDSRFPNTQPAGFSLSNGGGGGDYYPVFSANPRGGTVSFILGAGYAPADDAAGNGTAAMLYRVNRTGANASPILNRPLYAWQNYTTTFMRMDVAGRLAIGQDMTHSPSAQLQINSTIRGFLPPRMTTAQINAIASPANGLTVYNTDLNKLCVYELNAWKQVTTTPM
jgi:hypothetical protein